MTTDIGDIAPALLSAAHEWAKSHGCATIYSCNATRLGAYAGGYEAGRAAERQRIREAVFARYARFASLEEEVPEWLADLLGDDDDN